MPEPLKNIYSKSFIDDFTMVLKKAYPALDTNRFTKVVFDRGWAEKELKQRIRHIAETLHSVLPSAYPEAVEVLIQVTQELRKERSGEQYFEYMFLADFVEVYGIEQVEVSIKAMEQITQLSSAEYAVRPFLIKYPERMQQQMLLWAQHPEAMVRRLASEGYRPRLPWGIAIPYLKKDPSPVLPVLELLKNDPSENVRRSVANNLNDIAKDHPALVVQLAKKWSGQSPEIDWIVRHGSRTLLKRGHDEALQHFGLHAVRGVEILHLKVNKKKLRIGEELVFSFDLSVRKESKIRLEYAIDYVKASGKTNRKIFHLREGFVKRGEHPLSKRQAFKDLTTRKHYPGTHALAILVNGKEKARLEFVLGN
jgi:3-methyladenine DNA glycosylase AlkC